MMSQLAREFPEEYARIAALPPSQQNAAERELAARAALGEMTAPGLGESPDTMTKRCRNCDAEFECPTNRALVNSKWFNLCWNCLRYET